MPFQVECRSEFQYAQRPTAFTWEGSSLKVKEVLAGWRTPEGMAFRVQVEDGRTFELVYSEPDDGWEIKLS